MFALTPDFRIFDVHFQMVYNFRSYWPILQLFNGGCSELSVLSFAYITLPFKRSRLEFRVLKCHSFESPEIDKFSASDFLAMLRNFRHQ